MSRGSLVRACAVLAVFTAVAGTARADTVYSTFGPADAYSAITGWAISGSSSSVSMDFDEAARFTVGPNAYTLTSADLALSRSNPSDSEPTVWSLYSDAAGNPGVVLATATAQPTGLLPFSGVGGSVKTATFAPFLLAANTTYWLVGDNGDADTLVTWHQNNTGATGHRARLNGGAWVTFSDVAPAFRINGTPAAPPAVPTPQAATSCLALLGMLLTRRKRGEF